MNNLGKWNRNQLIDTNAYIRLFLNAVNDHLDGAEKRTLFMISRFYTFGSASVGERNFRLAAHYFEKGLKYFDEIPEEQAMLRNLLVNIYDRSRSFYYHRLGEYDKAIELIENTLSNNKALEKEGLSFLVFDRIQQYQNYARVLFSKGEPGKAMDMLASSVIFLINQKITKIPELEEHYLVDYSDEEKALRTQLLMDMLPGTAQELLLKKSDTEIDPMVFFEPIFNELENFPLFLNEDEFMRRWLVILRIYLTEKTPHFLQEADDYKFHIPAFASGKPHQIIDELIAEVSANFESEPAV